jgi:hypothetical protein
VLRAVEGVARRSERPFALGRRAARMRRIDELGIAAEVLENSFDDRRRLDAGDDAQPAAAAPAEKVNGKWLYKKRNICAGTEHPDWWVE